MDVVPETYVHFVRGRMMRRRGEKCPQKPSDEATGTEPHSLMWIGYRIELAREFERRCAVAEALGLPRPEFRE